MTTHPFECKLCGKGSNETLLFPCNDEIFLCRKCLSKIHGSFFRNIYQQLYSTGNKCNPRELKTLEIENFNCVIPPYYRFINFDVRKLNLNYIKQEFLWYLNGDKFDLSILQHAKMWKAFVNDDGSINSNYGQYIFGDLNQFKNVVNTLLKDKDSRRAVIMILQPYHLLNKKMKEVPCTYNISFKIRDDRLNMSVNMRSQDAWIGFASDIPCFSFIHEMCYVLLKEKYESLKYGDYYHHVDSFHIYEKHFNQLEIVAEYNDEYRYIYCPVIVFSDEVECLLRGQKNYIHDFTRWLYD
jgi:thymidylate synthase